MFANRVLVVCCALTFACPSAHADDKGAKPAEKTFAVEFKDATCAEIVAWYAEASGMKFDMKVAPSGTFTIRGGKDRKFALGEVTDLINERLIEEGLYLIRRHDTFVIVRFNEKIDPNLVPALDLKDLSTCGRTELVEVALSFQSKITDDDVAELKKLLGLTGGFLYAKDKWLVLRETAGNVERIQKIIGATPGGRVQPPAPLRMAPPQFDPRPEANRNPPLDSLERMGLKDVPKPASDDDPVLKSITLKFRKADEVAETILTLVGPRVQMIALKEKNQLLLYGSPSAVSLAIKIADEQDRPLFHMTPTLVPETSLPLAPTPRPVPKKYEFRFKDAKWDDVLDWYAKAGDLTLITTLKPKGTFTFNPPAEAKFTLGEITDIINDALVQQKLLLVPRRMTFFITDPDEERLNFVRPPLITIDDLDRWPKYFVASVVIRLNKLKPDDVVPDAKKLLGPSGSLVVFDKADALRVWDCVVNLRAIVEMVRAAEDKAGQLSTAAPMTFAFEWKDAKWDDVFTWYAKAGSGKADVRVKPKGTFTCLPKKGQRLTLGEVTDLINERLIEQKLLLFRGDRSFVVVRSDVKIDPKLIPAINPEELRTRGRTELVEVAFPLTPLEMTAEDAKEALQKMLTPFGAIVIAQGKWLVVRDTVENIVRIMKTTEDCCGKAPFIPPMLPPIDDPRHFDLPRPMPKPELK